MPKLSHKILFHQENGQSITVAEIKGCIEKFGKGYNDAVREIIVNSTDLTKKKFMANAARILNNFGMARSGAFKGVKFLGGNRYVDPNGNLKACWEATKPDLLAVKKIGSFVKKLKINQCQ